MAPFYLQTLLVTNSLRNSLFGPSSYSVYTYTLRTEIIGYA